MVLYVSSIFIWLIILYATASLLAKQILQNGWIPMETLDMAKNGNPQVPLRVLFVCMIPIFRFLTWVALFYMAGVKNDQ